MESIKEPINITACVVGVSAKPETGQVAPISVSRTGKRPHGKWDREESRGYEFSKDGHHHLMAKVRILNRKKNCYKEMVINVDTGNIVRDVEHPLSEHTGRGSAKPRRVDQA